MTKLEVLQQSKMPVMERFDVRGILKYGRILTVLLRFLPLVAMLVDVSSGFLADEVEELGVGVGIDVLSPGVVPVAGAVAVECVVEGEDALELVAVELLGPLDSRVTVDPGSARHFLSLKSL